jgi:hypothetical protein
MPFDDSRLPESLTDLVLGLPEDGWSPALMAVVARLVHLERGRLRSPRNLGLDGDRWDASSEQDLATACYFKCVLGVDLARGEGATNPSRLDALRVKARTEGVGIGYMRNAIRNHIRDLQRRQRPQATAVFQRFQKAITQLVDNGRLVASPASARLDKFSVLRFRGAPGGVVEYPELVRIVDSGPGHEKLVRRLGRYGDEPTQEVWDLLDHLEAVGCGGFKFGDLLDVLASLASEPSELASDEIDQVAGAGNPESSESDEVESRHESLFVRIRGAVATSKRSAKVRQRMLEMLEAQRDLSEQPGYAGSTISQIGAACGLDRRRASETWQLLAELVGSEFGIDLTDSLTDRQSGPRGIGSRRAGPEGTP